MAVKFFENQPASNVFGSSYSLNDLSEDRKRWFCTIEKNKLLVVLKILYSWSHVRFDKIVNDGCEPADRRLAGD